MAEISSTIRKLLIKRGIESQEDMEEFLSPSPRRTYDPFLLKNMEEGVSLLLEEAAAGERTCI